MKWWLIPVLGLVCGLHIYFAAITIQRSNQDPAASDQGAEMWLAAQSKKDPFPQRTDGVRHPLFSWLIRGAHTEDQMQFFQRGKWINTAFVVLFLCVAGVVISRQVDPIATTNLLLLWSLGILLVRGTYFQPEPLYYVLFFGCAVLAWEILRGATAKIYPIFGFLCGLAFLAKPSLLPFLAAFAGGVLLRMLATPILTKSLPLPSRSQILGAVIGVGIFIAMILPLGFFSQTHFGKPFFNYPKHWMWMDDFMTEAWPWQDKHPGRAQLEKIPPDDLPSMGWYFKRHSASDAFARLSQGSADVAWRFLFPEPKRSANAIFWRKASSSKKWEQPLIHRGIYLLALVGLCGVLLILSKREFSPWDPGTLAVAGFFLACLLGYILLYGWYVPIGKGDRFMGSLWMPVVYLVTIMAFRLQRCTGTPGKIIYHSTHGLILLSLLLQAASLTAFFLEGAHLTTRN